METPNAAFYKGKYKAVIPTIGPEDRDAMREAFEGPEEKLKRIYQSEASTTQQNQQEDEDEEEGENQSQGATSVDFEAQLKNEINSVVKEKLKALEDKVSKILAEHDQTYKRDFLEYKTHFKETEEKLNAYITEIHDGHIREIQKFKGEKDDQVVINSVMVKRLQKLEKQQGVQAQLNETYQNIGMIFDTFLKVYSASEQAQVD